MNSFEKKEIISGGQELISLLRKSRERQGIKLEEAARKTGINQKYLKDIEKGDFSTLPEGLYARNYLRQYAQFLGLDDQVLIEDFSREKIEPGKFSKQELFSRKAPGRKFFFAIPKLIKNILISLGVLLCVFYVVYSVAKIISPPQLEVFSPDKDITAKTALVVVEGKTEKEAEVTINDDLVLIDRDGYFSKPINLSQGLNLVTIVSKKKYSRKNIIERKIMFE